MKWCLKARVSGHSMDCKLPGEDIDHYHELACAVQFLLKRLPDEEVIEAIEEYKRVYKR